MKGYKVEEVIDSFREKLLIEQDSNYWGSILKHLKGLYKSIKCCQHRAKHHKETGNDSMKDRIEHKTERIISSFTKLQIVTSHIVLNEFYILIYFYQFFYFSVGYVLYYG